MILAWCAIVPIVYVNIASTSHLTWSETTSIIEKRYQAHTYLLALFETKPKLVGDLTDHQNVLSHEKVTKCFHQLMLRFKNVISTQIIRLVIGIIAQNYCKLICPQVWPLQEGQARIYFSGCRVSRRLQSRVRCCRLHPAQSRLFRLKQNFFKSILKGTRWSAQLPSR